MDRPDWWRSPIDLQLHLMREMDRVTATTLCGQTLPRADWEDPGDATENQPRCYACHLESGNTTRIR